jgi:hypothetical protein
MLRPMSASSHRLGDESVQIVWDLGFFPVNVGLSTGSWVSNFRLRILRTRRPRCDRAQQPYDNRAKQNKK